MSALSRTNPYLLAFAHRSSSPSGLLGTYADPNGERRGRVGGRAGTRFRGRTRVPAAGAPHHHGGGLVDDLAGRHDEPAAVERIDTARRDMTDTHAAAESGRS